jgi:hypothetical protein
VATFRRILYFKWFSLLRIIGICKHSLVISQLGGRKLVATVTLTQTLNTALKNQTSKARSNAAKSRAQLKKNGK